MLNTFRALAEPSRLQIVELLSGGPLPVGAVVQRLGIRQPQASKHLRVLSEAGLVEVRPVAQQRIYALRPEPLQELEVWLQRYRSQMEEQFGRLDDVLSDLKAGEKSTLKERAKRGVSKAKPR
jgi:DNA-binding transcriptional ArsR family regulator